MHVYTPPTKCKPIGKKFDILYCESCGWVAEEINIGMKGECPDCKDRLSYVSMTPNELIEIYNFWKENINGIKNN